MMGTVREPKGAQQVRDDVSRAATPLAISPLSRRLKGYRAR